MPSNNLLHAGCEGAGAGQKEGWYPGMLSVRGRSCFIHILLSDSWGCREVERDTLAKRVLPKLGCHLAYPYLWPSLFLSSLGAKVRLERPCDCSQSPVEPKGTKASGPSSWDLAVGKG